MQSSNTSDAYYLESYLDTEEEKVGGEGLA